ncbi:MAG: SPOR domain-containing protein [Proteobacteria bacterium]|nr:SPOR domain-containing protein [Pseudomonadota bacterium]
MQQHLKERLTGAAILVVIVVLLVPEMFRGRPASSVDSHAPSTDGAPMRTYTIDLRDSPNTQPPAAAPPVGAVNEGAPRDAASTPGSVGSAGTAGSAGAPGVADTPAQTMPAAPTVVASAPAPPATQSHASGGTSGWTVQVASFTRRDFADRMVKQVRAKGFAVRAVGPDDHGLYRVRSAPMSDHAAAVALKEKMQSRGLKPIVNAVP